MARFTQHDNLREILLATGDAKIIKHTENDNYRSDAGDGSGKNKLAKILMKVREELRLDPGGSFASPRSSYNRASSQIPRPTPSMY